MCALTMSANVHADIYPDRPVTTVVPSSAGGPVDTTTRILAIGLTEKLGQRVIVENLGGAAGSIAAGKAANVKPDGYTMMSSIFGTHVVNAIVYKLSYDVQEDFAPVLFTHKVLVAL